MHESIDKLDRAHDSQPDLEILNPIHKVLVHRRTVNGFRSFLHHISSEVGTGREQGTMNIDQAIVIIMERKFADSERISQMRKQNIHMFSYPHNK